VAAPKILPTENGGRGCAKNPADRKFTLSSRASRFSFHKNPVKDFCLEGS
jgi:hypothetical protein